MKDCSTGLVLVHSYGMTFFTPHTSPPEVNGLYRQGYILVRRLPGLLNREKLDHPKLTVWFSLQKTVRCVSNPPDCPVGGFFPP